MFLPISFLYSKGHLCSFPTRGRTSKLAYPIKRYSQNKLSDLKNDDFTFTLRLHLHLHLHCVYIFLHLHFFLTFAFTEAKNRPQGVKISKKFFF